MSRIERMVLGVLGGTVVALLICIGGTGGPPRTGRAKDSASSSECLPYRAPGGFAVFGTAIFWLLGRRQDGPGR